MAYYILACCLLLHGQPNPLGFFGVGKDRTDEDRAWEGDVIGGACLSHILTSPLSWPGVIPGFLDMLVQIHEAL